MIPKIKKRAQLVNKRNPVKILFPESEDKRIRDAVRIIKKEKIAIPVFLYNKDIKDIRKKLKKAKKMLQQNKVDAIITGATHSSVPTLLLSFNFMKKNIKKVSGSFLILSQEKRSKKLLLFADCAVQPDPSSEELAEIALLSAETFSLIIRKKPRIALLSYSTNGSGKGKSPEKVRQAVKILKRKYPKLIVKGEIQADAALNSVVARKKGHEPVNANMLIFPCLDAANIGYKLVERLGKFQVIGPILQGLNKQVNDLSRGCKVEDIVNLAAITVIQVNNQRKKR